MSLRLQPTILCQRTTPATKATKDMRLKR